MDDVAAMKAFAEAQELNFQLLSDTDGSAASKYGTLMKGRPFANRYSFVIDPAGVLRHIDKKVSVSSHGTDLAAVLRRLKQG